MVLDHDLRDIQAAKERLAACCALCRRQAQIKVQDLGSGLRRSLSNLNLGLAVVEQLLHLWRGGAVKTEVADPVRGPGNSRVSA